MNSQAPATLGRRIQCLRRDRELSQAELGRPEFTGSYVDAVECDRVRPSAEAIALLAKHLDVPVVQLSTAAQPPIPEPDRAALDEDIAYQLLCTRAAMPSAPGQVLRRLAAIEEEHQPYLDSLSDQTRFWLHGLRGMAYQYLRDPGPAQPALALALDLAPRLTAGSRRVVRIRNLVGLTYYMLDQPARARVEHEACLRALRTEDIRDVRLRARIYANLADDYRALNDTIQAAGLYGEALTLLEDVAEPEQQASAYWGLFQICWGGKNLDGARRYVAQALTLRETLGDAAGIAQTLIGLGTLEVECGNYAAATTHLARAQAIYDDLGEPLYAAEARVEYARLQAARGRLAEAAHDAEQSLAACENVLPAPGRGAAPGKAHALRTYARVLRAAGRVAEAAGQPALADTRFTQAIAMLEQTTYNETVFAVECAYADLLDERGNYALAVDHYRVAAKYLPRGHVN